MKLIELKCKNCGSKLKVGEDTKIVECEFCHSTFAVDDDNEYESVKEKLETTHNLLKRSSFFKINRIITILSVSIFLFVFGIIVYQIFTFNSKFKNDTNSFFDSFDVEIFNNTYSNYNGTTSGFLIRDYLDTIITNNKTNPNHIITVVFEEIKTSNPSEILKIKKLLDDDYNYEVSTDYDKNGYFNLLTIEK